MTTGLPRRRFMNTAALAGLGLGRRPATRRPRAQPPRRRAPPCRPRGRRSSRADRRIRVPVSSTPLRPVGPRRHTGDVRVLGMPPRAANCCASRCSTRIRWSAGASPTRSRRSWAPRPTARCATRWPTRTTCTPLHRDGNYDGRYAWVNDKINSRMARIRLDHGLRQDHRAAQRAGLPRHLPGQA